MGQQLTKRDELLQSIYQRSMLSNHNLLLDNQSFFHWLNQPLLKRRERFNGWFNTLNPLYEALATLLDLIRNSAILETKHSEKGGYQRQLDTQQSFQLVRVALSADSPAFPEIIGGKHRVNIRFLQYQDNNTKPNLIDNDIEFELACCGL